MACLRQVAHIASVSSTPLPSSVDAVVVGAGPAGLATSYELRKRAVNHVVLERGRLVYDGPSGTLRDQPDILHGAYLAQ